MTFNVCYAEDLISLYEENIEVKYPTGGIVLKEIEFEEEEFSVCTLASSGTLSVEEYIRQQLYNRVESIDLRGYRITLSQLSSILASNKDFIVASGYIAYSYDRNFTTSVNDRIVTCYEPNYLLNTMEEDATAREFIDENIKKYVDEIKPQTDDLLGRLLLLHDNLIEDCEYDADKKVESYSLYSVFAKKEMVCQGYAQAMYFIGRELGLDMGFCISFEAGHIWNYVKIGGEYYHVDATSDDPILVIQYVKVDENGELVLDENGDPIVVREERTHRTTALHNNFLLSDETIQSVGTNHGSKNGWAASMELNPVCNSKKYENNHLFNISAPFTTKYVDGYFNAVVNISNRSDVFRTKTLNTDAVIASNGYIESDIYYIFYAFTESIDDASFIFAADEGTILSDAKVMVSDAAIGNGVIADFNVSLSSIPYSQTGNNCLYVWSLKTLKPYCKKVYIR